MKTHPSQFGFGIETEHCLIDSRDFHPLFEEDLDFEQLLALVDSIPVSDFSTDGFNVKPLHRKASPYLIEGYYLTDEEMKPLKMLPKGIEVRTPISRTIESAVANLETLTDRLRQQVSKRGWSLCSISHHPTKSDFFAPPNYRRHDYWQWALTAMTTYGPDINISLPEAIEKDIDRDTLAERINFYLPSVVALSFASPLLEGKLWQVNGLTGKSVRTFKRSLWAPLYYIHTEPALRFEFKGFEMPTDLNDYKAFFLFGLSILLDTTLCEKTSDSERLRNLQDLAIHGLTADEDKQRAARVLESAEKIAVMFGLDSSPLRPFWKRLDTNTSPSDRIINLYNRTQSLEATLKELIVEPLPAMYSQPAFATLP